MLDKLRAVADRFDKLCFQSEQADFYADPKKATAMLREKNDLEPIVQAYNKQVAFVISAKTITLQCLVRSLDVLQRIRKVPKRNTRITLTE